LIYSNGVYIAKFYDGYRVGYSTGGLVELYKINMYPIGKKEYNRIVFDCFGNSVIYSTIHSATIAAMTIFLKYKEQNIFIDKGIQYLGELEHWLDETQKN
jgi:hypothetical protein